MVYRIFVEKKPGFAQEAEALRRELTDFLGVAGLTGLRILNRYDAEGIDKDLFDQAVRTVFSEPQVDTAVETYGSVDIVVNVAGAFSVTDPDAIEGKRVLLVDDIITTGATAAACTQALLDAGAQSVFAVALASSQWQDEI